MRSPIAPTIAPTCGTVRSEVARDADEMIVGALLLGGASAVYGDCRAVFADIHDHRDTAPDAA